MKYHVDVFGRLIGQTSGTEETKDAWPNHMHEGTVHPDRRVPTLAGQGKERELSLSLSMVFFQTQTLLGKNRGETIKVTIKLPAIVLTTGGKKCGGNPQKRKTCKCLSSFSPLPFQVK